MSERGQTGTELGLKHLATTGARVPRQEFEQLVDEYFQPVFEMYADTRLQEEIEGWSRSYYTLEGHLESIQRFNKPLIWTANSDYEAAVQRVITQFSDAVGIVEPYDWSTAFDDIYFISSSAAGYGYTGAKGLPENIKRAKRIANGLVQEFENRWTAEGKQAAIKWAAEESTPDIAFTRTQLAELPSIKVRNVFGEAFHYVFIEGVTCDPLIERCMYANSFYFLGADPTTGVPALLYDVKRDSNWLVVLDWTAFDASVQPFEINGAFRVIDSVLNLKPGSKEWYAHELGKAAFMSRKLQGPDGSLWLRTGGVPSGSKWTHIVDSIVNRIRIEYLFSRRGWRTSKVYTHGDDSLSGVQNFERPMVDELIPDCNEWGWQLNPAKCPIGTRAEDVDFLNRTTLFGSNFRDELRVLRLCLYPEYRVESSEISVARVKSILEDSNYSSHTLTQCYRHMVNLYGEHSYLPAYFRKHYQRNDPLENL